MFNLQGVIYQFVYFRLIMDHLLARFKKVKKELNLHHIRKLLQQPIKRSWVSKNDEELLNHTNRKNT